MSDFIAKAIGYLLAALVLLGPLCGLYLVSQETFEFLQYSGRENGEVVRCSSKRLSGSSSRYKKVPVVKRKDGSLVYGQVDEIRFIYECEDQIKKEVQLIFDEKNPKRVKINTFVEMWFLPIVMGLVCLILYPAFYLGYKNKKRKSR